jgi:hypothetical protein
MFNKKEEQQNPFYVGVTYCGSSVEKTKGLIDRVKNYTNLFVLMSGSLGDNVAAMEEIGNYAVASNLDYMVYGSVSDYLGFDKQHLSSWLIEAKERGVTSLLVYIIMMNQEEKCLTAKCLL